MMCLLILISLPHMSFLFVGTGFCRLASFSASLMENHLLLLILQGITPVYKRLTSYGKIRLLFLAYVKFICIIKFFQ